MTVLAFRGGTKIFHGRGPLMIVGKTYTILQCVELSQSSISLSVVLLVNRLQIDVGTSRLNKK